MATITIGKGDTLLSIAKKHGTTVAKLAAQNGITNVNKIVAGTTLNIGDTTMQTPAVQSLALTVNPPLHIQAQGLKPSLIIGRLLLPVM